MNKERSLNKFKQQSHLEKYQDRNQSSSFQQEKSNKIILNDDDELSFNNTNKKIKMIDFIDSLYVKYKVLKKLTQEQSNNFQTEIITMLIDEQENLDMNIYSDTVDKIGLSTFILQILSLVINRSKYHNHYEMNKNLSSITSQLEKQYIEVNRKKKEVERKENGLRKKQAAMLNGVKEKVMEMETKAMDSLMNAENQIKKRVNNLVILLKSKQKYVTERLNSLKQTLKQIQQFTRQQKNLDDKIKLLQKKQKQRKTKQSTSLTQNSKKISLLQSQIIQLQKDKQSLEEEGKRLNKKIKTNQLAYKHMKDEMERKVSKINQMNVEIEGLCRENLELKQKMKEMSRFNQNMVKESMSYREEIDRLREDILQIQRKQQQNERKPKDKVRSVVELDDLDISKIDEEIISKQKAFMFDNDNHNDNDNDNDNRQGHIAYEGNNYKYPTQQKQESESEQSDQFREQGKQSSNIRCRDDSNINLFNDYFQITTSKDELSGEGKLINFLEEVCQSKKEQKQNEDECKRVEKMLTNMMKNEQFGFQRIVLNIQNQFKMSKKLIQALFQVFLLILQPCDCQSHLKSLKQLYSSNIITFLQDCFIKYEATCPDIQQKSLIILSRILLSYQNHDKDDQIQIKMKEKYLKCLKLRSLVQKDTFIKANINFLLEYNN